MPKIEWTESMRLGIDEIDSQHQQWIVIINDLHDALIGQKNLTDMSRKTLDAMVDYGRFHFTFEEEYMRKINYPDRDLHKFEHDSFLLNLQQYRDKERRGELVLNTEIMKLLMKWLTNHILHEDKKYSRFRGETDGAEHV